MAQGASEGRVGARCHGRLTHARDVAAGELMKIPHSTHLEEIMLLTGEKTGSRTYCSTIVRAHTYFIYAYTYTRIRTCAYLTVSKIVIAAGWMR